MSGTRDVVVVTGASRGIGLAIAKAFLAEGAVVVGCDRDPSTELATEERYEHEQCDVTDFAALRAVVESAAARHGSLYALVNNAGVHPPPRPLPDVTVEGFEQLLRINLVSAVVASQAALPHLRASGGSIVNIASLVGQVGQDAAVEYCATKAALAGMTRAIALDEAAHGVRVNCVSPGTVLTPLAASLHSPEQLATIAGWAWTERMGEAGEIADVVVFLASRKASYVTGQDIVVAGGAELGYGLKGAAYYSAMAQG